MLGLTKARFILHELISQIPLFWNYENDIHTYIKLREKRRLFENQSGIKTVRVKTGFLKFIWKLKLWELNLKIEILGIKFKNWNFEN